MAIDPTCPKCQGGMRTYERNEVQIDQCTECRGIFLDRGELERLIDAEAAYNQTARSGDAAARPGQPPQPNQTGDDGWQEGRHHGKSQDGGRRGKRGGGFLGELFD